MIASALTTLGRRLLALLIVLSATVALAQDRGQRQGAPEQRQTPPAAGLPPLVAADAGRRAFERARQRKARLHGDRRYALIARSIGRALGGCLLHGLCGKRA